MSRELDTEVAQMMGLRVPTFEAMRAAAAKIWEDQPQVQVFHAPDGFNVGFMAVPADEAARAAGFSHEGCAFEADVARYSEDMAAAFLVVEKMREKGGGHSQFRLWAFNAVADEPRSSKFAAWFMPDNGGPWKDYEIGQPQVNGVVADTAPEAICRAALAACAATGVPVVKDGRG